MMPQPFDNAVITNQGLQLLTRTQSGETNIEFTRIVTGNGVYSEDEKKSELLQERNELKVQKNSYAISGIEVFSDKCVKITALITNQDPTTLQVLVDEGYYINEMGLYAKPSGTSDDTEGEEILYSIVVTAGGMGDFMPAYNGYNPAQIIQDYFVTVSNSSKVTIQGNNGAVALADDLKKKLNMDGEASNTSVVFEQAENLENISSGEKLHVIFGKIAKLFLKIKNAAFCSVINNLLATEAGIGVLDAYQGKVLDDKISELNRKWKANTVTNVGYVSAGSGQANKVWKTDANGNPAWRNDEDTTYPVSILSKPTFVNCTDAGTLVFKMGNVVTANVVINVSSSGVPNNTLAYITGLPKSRYALQVSAVYFSGSRMYPTRLRLGTDGILSNWYSGESYVANNPIICNFSYPV